jgi:hypothetical protein
VEYQKMKKFNVKAGLSVGKQNITEVIDEHGNASFNNLTVSGDLFATVQNIVTAPNQPNITSVGTLESLSVTGQVELPNISNVKISGGSNGQILSTNGNGLLDWVTAHRAAAYKYSREWHVDPVGGSDSTGNGSELNPFKTINHALTVIGDSGQTIFLHRGVYNENVTFTKLNVDIIGDMRSGAYQTGTWNFAGTNSSASVRVSGVQFANGITHSGITRLYLDRVSSNGTITKSSGGLLSVNNAEIGSSPFVITGGGQTVITNSNIGPISLGAASAIVTVKDCGSVASANITSGIIAFNNSFVFSLTESGNAITSSAGSFTYIQNSAIVTPGGAPARVSLGGFWSIQDSTFNRVNSTLSASNLSTTTFSDAITTFGSITAGGNISTTGYVATTPRTVAQLVAPNVAGAGARTFVNNATSTTFGEVVVGGGSNIVPVWSNGTSWLIG